MDKTGWNTHCFGRFLIDLPPTAKIVSTYKIDGDEIKPISITPEVLAVRIAQREHQLKLEKHETHGSMLVRRTDFENGSVSLLSWDVPYSELAYLQEAYFTTPKKKMYQYNSYVEPIKETIALQFTHGLASHMQDLNVGQIPTSPGYCIDGGFISGNDYRGESFSIDITLPEHPTAQIEFFASTGAEEDRLLERVSGFLQNAVVGQAIGLDTLRKHARDVGPIDAEEYLTAASGNGQRVYSFAWESQGKDDSLSQPNIGVNLGVLEQEVDKNHPYRPAFKSDDEALQLWDAIIDSIRLRPGAV